MDGVEAGPDLAARRMVMAAILYYELSTNVMSDHEYDRLAEFVRDNFSDVSDTLKFCIGEEWADDGLGTWTSSGFNFKYTVRLYNSALSWAEHVGIRVDEEHIVPFRSVDMDLVTGIEYRNVRS